HPPPHHLSGREPILSNGAVDVALWMRRSAVRHRHRSAAALWQRRLWPAGSGTKLYPPRWFRDERGFQHGQRSVGADGRIPVSVGQQCGGFSPRFFWELKSVLDLHRESTPAGDLWSAGSIERVAG